MLTTTSIRAAAAVALSAALLLVGAGFAGQTGAPKKADFDPKKKDVWRFLDDDLDDIRIDGAKAYQRGDYKTAARQYLAYLYRNGRDVRVIYNLARCYSRMGDADTATELLTRAAQRGFAHPELLQIDKEFDAIRDSRPFRNHQKDLGILAGTLGQTVAVSGPRINLYRLRLPASYDAGKAYPLVVGLHGNGSNADNLMQSLPTDAFPGMICAAPEGAYLRTDLASMRGEHFSWYLPDADRELRPALDELTSEYVLKVLDDVSQRHRVSKVILLGFSQGVSVAYLAALKHPDRVAGIVAFAGGFPATSVTPEQLKAGTRIRIMIAHGTEDAQVDLGASERARDALRQAGYNVRFETFEGGHVLPPDMMRSAGQWILSWM
jgi:phospholipase/carboxylesterase